MAATVAEAVADAESGNHIASMSLCADNATITLCPKACARLGDSTVSAIQVFASCITVGPV